MSLDVLPSAAEGTFYSIDENGRERYAEMNKGVTPVFYHEAVKNDEKSLKEGRPIYDKEERCRLFVAGDPHNQVVHPVTDSIKENWQRKQEGRTVSGTPLRAWPLLEAHHIAELEALNIFSVEGLANVADVHLARSQSLRPWRDRAVAWLASAKDGAEAVRLAEENKQLRSDMDDLKRQVAELAAKKGK
jgi:hypothetical protein